MSEQTFEPYWKKLNHGGGPNSEGEDPTSWVFYIVARISSEYRPLSVATCRNDGMRGSLEAFDLIADCRQLITIFSAQANRHTVEAEKGLAERHPLIYNNVERTELPEADRSFGSPSTAAEFQKHWRSEQPMPEFPFISTCLLQGLKSNPHRFGQARTSAQLEPLGTIYRDTSIEWGMVVIDITNLDAVAYGIVGFPVAPIRYISSFGMHQILNTTHMQGPASFYRAALRVAESPRHRRALSASEYLAKFGIENPYGKAVKNLQFVSEAPVITPAAMDHIWPITVTNTPYPRLLPDDIQKDAPETVIIETSWRKSEPLSDPSDLLPLNDGPEGLTLDEMQPQPSSI